MGVIAVLALAGALAVGEFAAAAVIAVMLATGRWLEERAQARAGRDLSVLLARAPRSAHLIDADGSLREVPLDVVPPGDHLLVRPGEVVPVDSVLLAEAVFDESALSGEPFRSPGRRATGYAASSSPPVWRSGCGPPLVGAILQEIIDVVAILSVLRAVLACPAPGPRPDDEAGDLLRQYSREHPALWPVDNRMRTAADGLDGGDPLVAMADVRETHRPLEQVLLPHEAAEDTLLYPAVGRVLGGYDPTCR